jgi:8-oxo-dGTP diphosphatase
VRFCSQFAVRPRHDARVRTWTVGGALIESTDGVLLVQNRRRGGLVDWTPPGGVIDEGEELLSGLAREVEEETGLVVVEWAGPRYEIEAVAPDLDWHLRVEVWEAVAYEGELRVGDDPDGIVVDARFVGVDDCRVHLESGHTWVREPLVEWLVERWVDARRYGYRVEGADPRTLVVIRT